jgi:hypothetical protein
VTADKCGGLKTIGRYMVNVEFQGVKVSSNALLEISENIREDIGKGEKSGFCNGEKSRVPRAHLRGGRKKRGIRNGRERKF